MRGFTSDYLHGGRRLNRNSGRLIHGLVMCFMNEINRY